MQRVLSVLVSLLFPVVALADGMVVPQVAFPATVTIPDQLALIHYTNGTERLVIETRFTGEGTDFAWVIPLPSRPIVEEATPGLFPTVRHLFRPRIEHRVTPYYAGVLTLIGLGYLLGFVRHTGRMTLADGAICLLMILVIGLGSHDFRLNDGAFQNGLVVCMALSLGVICSLFVVRFQGDSPLLRNIGLALILLVIGFQFLPVMLHSRSKAAAAASAPAEEKVWILDRRMVGVFETTTLASSDPGALATWLRENGYTTPSNSLPVIQDYVRAGWVFVAAKVRRTDTLRETNSPHPLSFTFQTEKPVYPMRLTGLVSDSLKVELYVFGPARARARHFNVERCARPTYPDLSRYTASYGTRPEPATIAHPLLRRWVEGSPVVTKLSATLSVTDMRQDVWLDWRPFREKEERFYSYAAARILAMNSGCGLFALGLAVAGLALAARGRFHRRFRRWTGGVVLASLGLGAAIYLVLPKMTVKLGRVPYQATRMAQLTLAMWFGDLERPTDLADAQAAAERFLSDIASPTTGYGWNSYAGRGEVPQNPILGGRFREEDSPGNFVIRQRGAMLELVVFDSNGAESVLQTCALRSPH